MRSQICPIRLAASLATIALLGIAAPANAQYIVPTAGGTLLFASQTANVFNGGGANIDDNTVNRTLPFTLSYFGVTHTTVDVSTNGNLNFSANTAFSNVAMPTTIARINALWDDLFLFTTTPATITENTTSSYYAVTWDVNTISTQDAVNRQKFQAVLFGANTTLSGFNFLAGDIAFKYAALPQVFSGGTATIGLDKGDGATFVVAPGAPAGGFYDVGSNAGATALPSLVGNNNFLLFRSNGNNGYNASIQSLVGGQATGPEPGSLSLLGLAALPVVGIVIRRRRLRKRPHRRLPLILR